MPPYPSLVPLPFGVQEICTGGIKLCTNDQGLPSGECYVVFANEDTLAKAMERNRQVMGHRFVTVERANKTEFLAAFPPAPAPAPAGAPQPRAIALPSKSTSGTGTIGGNGSTPMPYISAATAAAPTAIGTSQGSGKGGAAPAGVSARGSGSANGACRTDSGGREEGNSGNIVIKMRGLPYSTTEQEIISFFSGLRIPNGGVSIGRDASGRASGEAHVEFASDQDAQSAMLLNRQRIGSRYIELFRTRQAPSATRRALAASSEGANSSNDCLRLRGMPFNSTEADVQNFFKGCATPSSKHCSHNLQSIPHAMPAHPTAPSAIWLAIISPWPRGRWSQARRVHPCGLRRRGAISRLSYGTPGSLLRAEACNQSSLQPSHIHCTLMQLHDVEMTHGLFTCLVADCSSRCT